MTDELKPVNCGCGGEASMCYGFEHRNIYAVECDKCGICTCDYDTEAEAIEAWNRAMGAKTAKVEGNRCTACDNYIRPCMKYCDHCGAKLDWSDDE